MAEGNAAPKKLGSADTKASNEEREAAIIQNQLEMNKITIMEAAAAVQHKKNDLVLDMLKWAASEGDKCGQIQ